MTFDGFTTGDQWYNFDTETLEPINPAPAPEDSVVADFSDKAISIYMGCAGAIG